MIAELGNQHCFVATWFEVERLGNRNRSLGGRRSWHIPAWPAWNLVLVNINILGMIRRLNTAATLVDVKLVYVHVHENFSIFPVTLGSDGLINL
jgi:hypothetical protein